MSSNSDRGSTENTKDALMAQMAKHEHCPTARNSRLIEGTSGTRWNSRSPLDVWRRKERYWNIVSSGQNLPSAQTNLLNNNLSMEAWQLIPAMEGKVDYYLIANVFDPSKVMSLIIIFTLSSKPCDSFVLSLRSFGNYLTHGLVNRDTASFIPA